MRGLGIATCVLLVAVPSLAEETTTVTPTTSAPTTSLPHRGLRGIEGLPLGTPGFGMPPPPTTHEPGTDDSPRHDQ
jgi:hypothetical protein